MSYRVSRYVVASAILVNVLVPCAVMRGTPVPVFSLQTAVDKAEIVAVANVDKISIVGNESVTLRGNYTPGRRMRALLHISGILKGSLMSNDLIVEYFLPDVPAGYSSLGAGTTRIVFLRQAGTSYQLADPIYPSLPAISQVESSANDPVGRVIEQEAAVLSSAAPSLSEKEEALRALNSAPELLAKNALVGALPSATSVFRLELLARLAAFNYGPASVEACQTLLAPPVEAPDYVLHNLRVGIRDGVGGEDTVRCLAQLILSRDDETREAAAAALRRTGSLSAVDILKQSLTDPDRTVRYEAVIGIATFAGESNWKPSLIQFDQNEAKYVDHWKSWTSNRIR